MGWILCPIYCVSNEGYKQSNDTIFKIGFGDNNGGLTLLICEVQGLLNVIVIQINYDKLG